MLTQRSLNLGKSHIQISNNKQQSFQRLFCLISSLAYQPTSHFKVGIYRLEILLFLVKYKEEGQLEYTNVFIVRLQQFTH